MASLYEITNEFIELERLYEDSIDEETGELCNTEYLEALEVKLGLLLEEKSEGVIKYMKNMESDVVALKSEEKRLNELRKRKEKKIEGFKRYLEQNLNRMGKNKINTALGTISLRKSIQTLINEDIITYDERYSRKIEIIKYDKASIKKLLEEGVDIEGASVVDNYTVSIK
ncbi:MAG: siphovirus Gp157 family protein [Cetobacterium sp.]